jgi:6-phosphogluconolactonase
MAHREIIRCRDAHALFQYGASLFTKLSRDAIARTGRFTVALSGGSTPRGLYGRLATDAHRSHISWKDVHLFWGDERCVPPEHPDSNYRMAFDALLSHIQLPDSNIHRPRAEDPDPASAAADYEREMRAFFALGQNEFPRFDLLLLGIGDDGHTASLFPGSSGLTESRRIFIENFVEKLNAFRLTLTFPAINSAAAVAVLASGKPKAGVLKAILNDEPVNYPVQQVNPLQGKLIFIADEAALGGE